MTTRKNLLTVLGVLVLVAAVFAATQTITRTNATSTDASSTNASSTDKLTAPSEAAASQNSAAESLSVQNSEVGNPADSEESGEPEVLAPAPVGDQPGWQPIRECVNGLVIRSDGTDWRIDELAMESQPLENGEVPRRALIEFCGVEATEEDLQAQAEAVESLAGELALLGPITFDPGTSDLSGQSADVLDIVAGLLRDQPGTLIEVAGYAKSLGSQAENLFLSEDRAAAIVSQLEQRGVLNEMVPIGRGDELLRQFDKDDAEALSQDRRIEFRVIL